MTTITYMPTSSDNDVVYVNDIPFHAYKPVDVANQMVANTMSRNPWFTSGAVDEERYAAWKQARLSPLTADADKSAEDKLAEI